MWKSPVHPHPLGFVPTFSAEAMVNLEKANIILGKANMDEFAMGSTMKPAYGLPGDPGTRSMCREAQEFGGNRSGRECYFALGSDTGGSIRQPAGFCGVVGMKPVYGTLITLWTHCLWLFPDQIGPLCRMFPDCAAVLEAISSHDTKDSTSWNETDFTSALTADVVSGMRIGIPETIWEKVWTGK